MSKTNSLKKLITEKLKPICDRVYFNRAINSNLFPHIIFNMRSVNFEYSYRDDVILEIDVWNKPPDGDFTQIEEMCDNIEKVFSDVNLPQKDILPTFYIDGRYAVEDEGKFIQHRVIRILIQNYEKGANKNG